MVVDRAVVVHRNAVLDLESVQETGHERQDVVDEPAVGLELTDLLRGVDRARLRNENEEDENSDLFHFFLAFFFATLFFFFFSTLFSIFLPLLYWFTCVISANLSLCHAVEPPIRSP